MTRYYQCDACGVWLYGGLLCVDCARREEAETRQSLSLAKEPTP